MSVRLRRAFATPSNQQSIRVGLALCAAVIPCAYAQWSTFIIPLVLGIIAAALAESDGPFWIRVKSHALMLLCFFIASVSIEVLFPHPILFAIGLLCSTFGFIMLGAIGPRYANLAFASLLLAIYTMLGAKHSPNLWFQPILLLSGALGYSLLSFIWALLWPNQAVQQNLAQLFDLLGDYLNAKGQALLPLHSETSRQRQQQVIEKQAQVTALFEQTKASLLQRLHRNRMTPETQQHLHVYFLAQDIHERISSTHYRPTELKTSLAHSDILFRVAHLLQTQSEQCKHKACFYRINDETTSTHDTKALIQLQESLAFFNKQATNPTLSMQLRYLLDNLAMISRHLERLNQQDLTEGSPVDPHLFDPDVHSWKDAWQRIKAQFTTQSLVFRHGIRLSLALTIGYGLLQKFQLDHGYWILLTTLFVCQPNYQATKLKLKQRVFGTLIGLGLGFPLLMLFPSTESQWALMIATGILFFVFRQQAYGIATASITLLVLFAFNQQGQGFEVILPRLFDTLLGCGLAILAVYFILPDWQCHKLPDVISQALNANRDYLAHVLAQYRHGRKDDLAYRIARRHAYDGDAQLTRTLQQMMAEPAKYQRASDASFRCLAINHRILAHISALGAHRQQLSSPTIRHWLTQVHPILHRQLSANALLNGEKLLLPALPEYPTTEAEPLILQQLRFINRQLPALQSTINEILISSENLK
jgi:uncharacterized membrane protein (TIGR01666 family)